MMNAENLLRIPADQMQSEFTRILIRLGFEQVRAEKCAEIFTVSSLEGIYSHGVNRFPRFVKYIKKGYVIPDAVPSLIHRSGCIEQWEGNFGPGPLNATFATDRAVELAGENSTGIVTLARTNHWMRGGTYGLQAARKGFALICWTNTCPNMPAWGAKDPRLGNNPMVFAVPYKNGAIVFDFAMSQFSYGKIESYAAGKKALPFAGGYNRKDELTTAPQEILESWRILPAGYWKGSGLAFMLDIFATILSGGSSTHEIKSCEKEYVSQVFIALNIKSLSNFPFIEKAINGIINDLHSSVPSDKNSPVRYPGEKMAGIRSENTTKGIPVSRELWEKIITL